MRSLALACLLVAPAAVAAPVLVAHQGRLLDVEDRAVTQDVSVTFAIYKHKAADPEVAASLVPLWTQTYAVSLHQGHYALYLGEPNGVVGTHAPLAGDTFVPSGADLSAGLGERFLGVKIGDGPELKPRLRFGVTPLALTAQHAALAERAREADHALDADHAKNADDATSADRADVAEALDCAGCVKLAHVDEASLAAAFQVAGSYVNLHSNGAAAQAGDLAVTGTVTAGTFAGSGASLTGLKASAITGTLGSAALEGRYDKGLVLSNDANEIAGHLKPAKLTMRPVATATCTAAGEVWATTDGQLVVCSGPGAARAAYLRPPLLDWESHPAAGVEQNAWNPHLLRLSNGGDVEASGLQFAAPAGWTVTSDCGTTLGARRSCSVVARPASATTAGGDLAVSATGLPARKIPLTNHPRSCAAVKAANPSAVTGTFDIDPDGSGGADPFKAHCLMEATFDGGGYTLLITAKGDSTKWGSDSARWTDLSADATPTLADDYKSPAFNTLATSSIQLCSANATKCFLFPHSMGIPLRKFFTDNLSYVHFSNNSTGIANVGDPAKASAVATAYAAALGRTSVTAMTCQWLGINEVRSASRIGFLSDANAGCASLYGGAGYAYHDDGALGLGLQSCNDSNGCTRGGSITTSGGGAGNIAGEGRSVDGTDDNDQKGLWFVYGR